MCAISAFTCRIKVQLFGALTRQEIGFFETTKTGEALVLHTHTVYCMNTSSMDMANGTSHGKTQ